MGHTLQLYQLQSLDSEIDKINQQLADIAAQLGESETLKQAQKELETAEHELRTTQTKQQDLDLEVKGLTTKIDSEEKKLYSGKVINAKEAANLQDEVSSLKRRQSEREELLLEAMLEVETAEESVDAVKSNLAEIEAAWATGQEQLKQSQQDHKDKLAELTERRPAVVDKIDPEQLQQYEKLRPKKAGRAVAIVKSSVCQGCGVMLSNSRVQQASSGPALTYCTTCGRILYVP